MAYATVQDFRNFTGISSSELTDAQVQEYIAEANDAIKRDGFVRFEKVLTVPTTDPTGTKRYYLIRRYLADGNMDGTVDASDLQVFEFDSWDVVDITSQVASWNSLTQYFTLNPGYPTNSRQVAVTYYAAAGLPEQIADAMKKATLYFSATLGLQTIGVGKFKKGITSMSVDGLSLSKGAETIGTLIGWMSGKNAPQPGEKPSGYWSQINYIKPTIMVPTMIGGFIPPETMQGSYGLSYGRSLPLGRLPYGGRGWY